MGLCSTVLLNDVSGSGNAMTMSTMSGLAGGVSVDLILNNTGASLTIDAET